MFSGLVTVATLRAFGSVIGTTFTITGIVTRKMMSITSMMSTSGTTLMVQFNSSSSCTASP